MRLETVTVVLGLLIVVNRSEGLKCYTCSATENESDTSCDDDLDSLATNGITDCDKKYCTITRIDYLDPRGKLASINRNCVDKVPADGITEDSTFRTYQRSCKTDLCNSGSGKSETNAGTTSLGDKSTIYAPGTGRSSAMKLFANSCTLLLGVIFVFQFHRA